MLAVFTKMIFADESDRRKFLSIYEKYLPSFRAESGCDKYHVSVDPEEPQFAYLFEIFVSTEDLEYHRKTPDFGKLVSELGILNPKFESTYMSVAWSGPHAPGEGG